MAYINRELAISKMEQVKKEHSFLPQICIKAIDVAINAFKIIPTANVEEVVKCEGCKYRYYETAPHHDGIQHFCSQLNKQVPSDFYCAYGERRET